jgi:putative flippase GtrA
MTKIKKLIKLYLTPQFLKFFISGSTAFLSDFLTLNFLSYILNVKTYLSFGIFSISVANLISTIVGTFVTYTLNKYWSFKSTEKKDRKSEVAKFLTVIALNYIISNILFGFIAVDFHVPEPITKIIVTGLQMIWTFLLYKFFVFKPAKKVE